MTLMSDELWNKRREEREAAVMKTVLELFEFMGSAGAFRIDIDPAITIVAGPKEDLPKLLEDRPMTPYRKQ
jgi:hypothetical protein